MHFNVAHGKRDIYLIAIGYLAELFIDEREWVSFGLVLMHLDPVILRVDIHQLPVPAVLVPQLDMVGVEDLDRKLGIGIRVAALTILQVQVDGVLIADAAKPLAVVGFECVDVLRQLFDLEDAVLVSGCLCRFDVLFASSVDPAQVLGVCSLEGDLAFQNLSFVGQGRVTTARDIENIAINPVFTVAIFIHIQTHQVLVMGGQLSPFILPFERT